MKKLITAFFILLTFYSFTFSQAGYSPLIDNAVNSCTYQSLSLLNRQLSGDTACTVGGNPVTILSRQWNNTYNTTAQQFIYEKFQSYGYTPYYMNFNALGTNVYAVRTGTKYPNKKYIICGHFDDMPSGSLAPGADDNASGTCAVLEAARVLASFQFDYTIIFIAFDEEERGLYGSKAYSDTAYLRQDSIMGVFNYDMISWDGNNDYRFDIISNSASVTFADLAKSAFNLYQPQVAAYRVINNNMQGSDHWYFWQKGWKAYCGIEYTGDFNPYYHTVNDKFQNIKMNYFLPNTRGAIASLACAGWDAYITMTHTALGNTSSTGPVEAKILMQSPNPIAKLVNSPRLYFKINDGAWSFVNPAIIVLDTFKFTIPGQSYGSAVSYYFAAQDSLGKFSVTYPYGGKGLTPPGTTAPPTVFTYNVLTGIEPEHDPVKFSLDQNYPNPFNPVTNIRFYLPKSSEVRLIITDMLGRTITELVNAQLPYGENIVRFDAKQLSSGIYLYSLFADGMLISTKKMTLIK